MQIAVLSSDPRIVEALRAAGLSAGAVSLADLEAGFAAGAPAALVLDIRGPHQIPAGLAALRRRNTTIGIVLIASALDQQLMLEAMRAGVNECLQEPVTREALEQAVRNVIVGSLPSPSGQVFAFVGAKGGVGTTTLAVNTAASLARTGEGGGVLLIDLHQGFGDASVFLGAEPRFTIADALENVSRVDEAFFRGLVEKTKAHVDLLGSADRMAQGATDPGRVRLLLDFARRAYRFTVLDVPRSDMTLDALEAVTNLVVVTSQELPSLRSAGRLAHTLRSRYGAPRVKAVMNRFDKRAEIAHGDVERVIGDAVKHLIPSDYFAALEALNHGRPVALEQGTLPSALRALAYDLGGVKKRPTEKPQGVLGRLAFRRA
jgi:pilus assembly protein CpaE